MRQITEKGTEMNRIEHSARKLSHESTHAAMLHALLRGQTNPRFHRSHLSRLFISALLATLVAAFAITYCAPTALATAPPSLQLVQNQLLKGYGEYGHKEIYVYSSRLFAEANLFANGLNTKWYAEYSTSKSALEGGSGIIASSGELAGEDNVGGAKEI